jgi:hypothetical protein
MATLLLQAAGTAIGTAIGGPFGAVLGRAVGALAGYAIDQSLLGSGASGTKIVEGPRLKEMNGLSSTEGDPIPRVYGRVRLGGQVIWATRFEEVATTTVKRSRSSGGKGGAASVSPKQIDVRYSYFANLAIGICEGPISFIRRIWADGREIDQTNITMRVYKGSATQLPDPLIIAKEGANYAPAYRDLAYIVFERLPLADYGNRIPQFTFEVVRAVDGLAQMIKAVCLIPGASEFAYDTEPVMQAVSIGTTRADNRHQLMARSNVSASLDALQALCPNLQRVSLVVSWFGDDLRAGSCSIAPRVEDAIRATDGATWGVAERNRSTARVVSQVSGKPAYGGTPSDASVVRLIQNLKARGLEVVLYPFIMMDVAAGNTLTDPWTGVSTQPAFPWRGRITCDPAPDRAGSPDGTGVATSQIAALFGTAAASDFSIASGTVTYTGVSEWTLRRQILHYAHLAELAGGVHGFIIGSEMVSLTRVRSASGVYPAVHQYVSLANAVRGMLRSSTKITYAADWTEYGAHVLSNGAEVRFPLDPLWASSTIDAVGIDFYPPISDWRDEASHLDDALTNSVYDLGYLRERLGAGEAFDWYYATPSNRDNQIRTQITDGAYNKAWMFRAKDLKSWWQNAHVERVGGVELSASTAWIPQSKPIWLTEIGIPAVNKGTNGPNVFPDPKSSESAYPPFSNATRDDLMQVRGLEAIHSRFDVSHPDFVASANPISTMYNAPMISSDHMFVWAWDARPFPAFPDLSPVWADGPNWQTGHWITGRLEGAPLDSLTRQIIRDMGLTLPVKANVEGWVDGYVVDRPMSARDALEPLMRLFGVDVVASGGEIAFQGRSTKPVITLSPDVLIPDKDGSLMRLTRAQETDLPVEVRIGFTEGEADFRRSVVASRRLSSTSKREAKAEMAVVMRRTEALRLANIWLQDVWVARESLTLALPLRYQALQPADTFALQTQENSQVSTRLYRITRIQDAAVRTITARLLEPSVYDAHVSALPERIVLAPAIAGKPAALILDLPIARESPETLQYMACYADPWPQSLAVWRSLDGETFELFNVADVRSVMGSTLTPLGAGALWRWDSKNSVEVTLLGGFPSSISDMQALSGQNTFAVQGVDGTWEIFTAAKCELIGTRRYRLSRLLRGLGGSEKSASRTLAAGASIVLLDDTLIPLAVGAAELGRTATYRIGPVNKDHADSSYISITAIPSAIALKPYAPVRVKAKRLSDGIHITFIRCTRMGGDGWEAVEVPLSEENERYELDILSGASVVRTLSGTSPDILYPTSLETTDFGVVQSSLTLRVVQLSTSVGRGEAWEGSVVVV